MAIAGIICILLYGAIPVMAYVAHKKCEQAFECYVLKASRLLLSLMTVLSISFVLYKIYFALGGVSASSGPWLLVDYVVALGYITSITLMGMGADLYRVMRRRIRWLEFEVAKHEAEMVVDLPETSDVAIRAGRIAVKCGDDIEDTIADVKKISNELVGVSQRLHPPSYVYVSESRT